MNPLSYGGTPYVTLLSSSCILVHLIRYFKKAKMVPFGFWASFLRVTWASFLSVIWASFLHFFIAGSLCVNVSCANLSWQNYLGIFQDLSVL